jgi:cytochrome c
MFVMLAVSAAPVLAYAEGDPDAGRAVFSRCALCHSNEPGRIKIGPSLFGVVGRKAGTMEGVIYSPAMKEFGKTWTTTELNNFLQGTAQAVPGTKMGYPGVSDPTDRANVIAYLTTLK